MNRVLVVLEYVNCFLFTPAQMSSRWKRVDLFRLSSVAPASAARRRTAAVTSALQDTSCNPTPRCAGCADSERAVARGGVQGGHRATPQRRGAQNSCKAPLTATSVTRVSISRLLGGSSLAWQDSLACFVELVERDGTCRQSAGNRHMRTNGSDASPSGADREDRSKVSQCEAVPLEAILSLYANLRRRAPQVMMKQDEATAKTSDDNDEDLVATWTDEKQRGNGASSQLGGAAALQRDSCEDASLSCLSPSANVTALRFLCYAAQHHAALQPIRRVLTAAFADEVSPLVSYPASAQEHTYRRQGTSLTRDALPPEQATALTQLLSVATVLHVGLGEMLRDTAVASHSTASTSPSSEFVKLQEQGQQGTQQQQRRRWMALRVLHHLVRYGGAEDYLAALADGVASTAVDSSQHEMPLTSAGTMAEAELQQQCDRISTKDWSGWTHDRRRAAVRNESEEVRRAQATLEAAAHQRPCFTLLLQTLQEAWEAHHARLLAAASPTAWTTNAEVAFAEPDGAVRAVLDDGDDGGTPAKTDRPSNVVRASLLPSTHATPAASATATASSAEAAALAMVRSLPQAGASASLHPLLVRGGEADDVGFNGATMSTSELACVTIDVVYLAWNAMRLFTNSPVVARPIPAEGYQMSRQDTLLRRAECDALFRLTRTATCFVSYANLCTWLQRLLLSPTMPALQCARDRHSNANKTVPLQQQQQRAVLLCLLTRAVRRAPSWSAVCAVLREFWPHVPPPSAPSHTGPPASGSVVLNGDVGFATCEELLDAFFESPHSPARQPHAGERLAFWCDVVCSPYWQSDSRVEAHPTTTAAVTPAVTPTVTLAVTPAAGKEQDQRLDAVEPCEVGDVRKQQELLDSRKWSRLLYGSAPHRSRPSLRETTLWNASVTAAASRLVRRWLLPVAAHDAAMDSLAACHARCAEAWAASTPLPSSKASTSPSTARHRSKSLANDEVNTVWRAEAVAQLAEQHRAFSSLFLTQAEAFDWWSLAVRSVKGGAARQLLLAAAAAARWCANGSGAGAASHPHPQQQRLDTGGAAAASTMVADLTRVFQQWTDLSSDDATGRTSAVAATSLASTHSLCTHKERRGRLGEVGLLFDDVVSALTTLPPSSSFLATAAQNTSSSLSTHAPPHRGKPSALLSDSIDTLHAVVRRCVTAAGLRWEFQTRADVLGGAARKSAKTTGTQAAMTASPPLYSAAVRDDAPRLPGVDTTAVAAESSLRDSPIPLARLREWLDFLCTCPRSLLAEEEHAVVWLYLLMRQVEEMRAWAASDSEAAVRGLPTRSSATPTSTVTWSTAAEEAAVRRAAQALSQQLWSVLPSSSLLPPMLLNWLLTRGGVQTWGEAVRFLRAAALQDKGSPADANTSAEEANGEVHRRFLLLALPLDRISSVSHAMRVLRTLQVVEKRCEDSLHHHVDSGEDAAAASHEKGEGKVNRHRRPGGNINIMSSAEPRAEHQASEALSLLSKMRRGNSKRFAVGKYVRAARQLNVDASATDVTAAAAHLARHYYRAIERVLLREWYRRAVAAVLDFLAQHPEHTFLTAVVDAPEHAALTVRERWAEKTASTTHTGGSGQEAETLASLWEPTITPSAFMQGSADAATLSEWRTWLRDARNGTAKLDDVRLGHATTTQASVPATAQTTALAVQDVLICSGEATCRTAGVRAEAHQEGARAQQPQEPDSAVSLGPPRSPTAPTCPPCVPLHFVGAFLLQECRVGVSYADDADEGVGDPTREAATTPLPAPTTHGYAALFTRSVTASKDDRAPPLGEPAASSAQSIGVPRARPVRPDLLEMFRRVLELKKAEKGGTDKAEGMSQETIEDVVCEILTRQASHF